MRKLTNAPSFCHTASPQDVESGWGKTRKWLLKYDIRHNKEHPKAEKMLNAWFKMQIRAKMW